MCGDKERADEEEFEEMEPFSCFFTSSVSPAALGTDRPHAANPGSHRLWPAMPKHALNQVSGQGGVQVPPLLGLQRWSG